MLALKLGNVSSKCLDEQSIFIIFSVNKNFVWIKGNNQMLVNHTSQRLSSQQLEGEIVKRPGLAI